MKMIDTSAKLLLICLWSVLIGLAAAQDVADWKLKYDQIFGPDAGDSSPMSGTELMRSMMFLHDNAYDLDSIGSEAKAKADFWFDKVFGFTTSHDNTEDCNVDFLRRTSGLYRQQNAWNNPNFEQLYLTFRKNLIEFCCRHFSDLPLVFHPDVSADKLANLWKSYSRISAAHSEKDSANILIKPVLELVDLGWKASEAQLTQAWAGGPCQTISSELQQPAMKHYSDFVEMCAEDSENFQAHCSEPVRLWVNFVRMCKHIDALMPYIIENIRVELAKTEELWKNTYDELFAPLPHVTPMNKPRLLHSLMFLQAKADRMTTVDESSKKTVEFWFDSFIEFDIYDCRVDFLRETSDLYCWQNHMGNPNFKQLYVSFRKTLIDFCDARFLDLPDKLGSRVSDANLLNFLTAETSEDRLVTPRSPSPFSNPDLAEALANSAIRSCEAGNRGTAVIDAWRQGPCAEIESALKEPSMGQYADFVDLILFDRREYLEHCSVNNRIWVRVVLMCRILDRWIPYFADNDLIASMVRRVIRHNFDINSLDDMMDRPIPTGSPSVSGSNTAPPEERVIGIVSSTPSTPRSSSSQSTGQASTAWRQVPPRMRRGRY